MLRALPVETAPAPGRLAPLRPAEISAPKPPKLHVFRFVHHAHSAATELFDDAVRRDVLADE